MKLVGNVNRLLQIRFNFMKILSEELGDKLVYLPFLLITSTL